ncbi:MAG: hypothetical protein B6229_04020 [Spirochaetaceae bacterium 4572_7]|nr:MAG: hypothetical protein B6229_04020 [Spirochaetaceae bacterium 4572_7]
MKKKLTLVIILNILSLYLFSENSLTIGSSNEFKDFSLTNLSIVKGLQGYDNLEISPREYKPSLSTDLLMHFNDISFTDYANNYIVTHYDNINSVEKVLISQ